MELLQNQVLRRADMFHATSEKEYEEIRALGYQQPVVIVPIGMEIPELKDGGNGERGERGENLARLRAVPTVRICFARWWKPWMLQWGYMPPHPAIFIRKECFEKWGGYEPDRKEYRIAADYELLIRYFRVNRLRAKYVKLYTTVMRTGGVSTKDLEARKKLNREIVKANRANGYFCCWPMLLPKYAVKIWEIVLPRFGIM